MAVLQMQRINICALKTGRKAILERLQELGAVEIDIPLEDDDGYERSDVGSARASFERRAQTADRALEVLDQYAPEKTGMLDSLAGKPLVEKEQFNQAIKAQKEYVATAQKILDLDKQAAEKKAEIQKCEGQLETLVPWMSLPVPVTYKGTEKTAVLIGTLAAGMSLDDIYALIAKGAPEADAVDVELLSEDRDYAYLAVLCLREDAPQVEGALRAGGFAKPALTLDKVPSEYQTELKERIGTLGQELEALKQEIAGYAGRRSDLRMISDYYRVRAEKYEIIGTLPQTENTFALSGYVPAHQAQAIAREMTERFGAAAEVEDIRDEEDAPVVLKNNRFSESVEGVVASFGLPAKGEIDPSFITSIFYVFLFGMMLSDAAYGLIVSIACGAAILKFPRMDKGMKKSLQLFFWCGISTLVWGILFGGYFGDVVDVVSETFFGHKVTIPALWFVPLNDPMKLLLYSLLFGVIHLFTGLALKGYMCLKDGKYVDFLCDCVLWFLLLIGLIGMLLPSDLFAGVSGLSIVFPSALVAAFKWMAIIGAVGIVLMSGRANKNIAVRLALGAYDLYGITSWLSDVLSYSRLLALGLATGVIASVVNKMGSMGGGSVLGAIIFIAVFIIGHVFNLAINLLGAYVHSNRLEYVEFFGKFYEGGGREFAPFHLNTKYMDIKEEK